MKLISINIGRPRPVPHEGRVVSTGIFKEPVAGPVLLRRLNLDGDGQADLRVHGGTDKAVYAYPFEHYAFWEAELGRKDFAHGQFGENFTITGWLEDAVCIGDEFQIGAARVQVTQPRTPCFKLGIRMGDDQFVARFAAANRTGFYLRVLQEGRVSAGDAIERVVHDAGSMSVRDVFRLRHGHGTRVEYEHAACLQALSPSWRAVFEKRLKE
ncbi:molybdenum cofactor biosysynthesis protein [Sulfuricaulis limicola]|uniref:Molybdenum cofactor biosysynthesis protein n=1 Tax=Sulfuricaulis limicola TaxID=1620215 RepID=A0A1B4XDA0_9GAMM|nr:MOSC domain-containing protein [Sulfuricaulis limicola]BAV32794.1 molybdenum cofactor biosysynthesis protein [Sulfuricaulis limicola]